MDASKSIIFGTKNHLGQNFGVQIAWLVSSTIVLSITIIFQRRKTEKANMRARWQEMKERDRDHGGAEDQGRGTDE